MSWSGYIPGSLIREYIEREEARLFAENDENEVRARIENIIDSETYVLSYGGCGCVDTELQDVDGAAKVIYDYVKDLVTPKDVKLVKAEITLYGCDDSTRVHVYVTDDEYFERLLQLNEDTGN
jgi:hypothetical protein